MAAWEAEQEAGATEPKWSMFSTETSHPKVAAAHPVAVISRYPKRLWN